jgi:DNA-binding protein HU-beta
VRIVAEAGEVASVNKSALVSEVSKRADLSRAEAAQAVEAMLDVIRERVTKGQRVSLAGFGTFERKLRNPRVGRNPHTREAVKIPARKVPSFKPGTKFREAVAAPRRRTKKPTLRQPRKR